MIDGDWLVLVKIPIVGESLHLCLN
jgi:hypothetical protein